MRRLEFDAEEFPDQANEELLTLTLERKGRSGLGEDRHRARDLRGFLVKCMGDEPVRTLPPGALAFVTAYPGTDVVLEHLRNFAGLSDAEVRSASLAVIRDQWNQREIAVETSSWFVLYQWMTTA